MARQTGSARIRRRPRRPRSSSGVPERRGEVAGLRCGAVLDGLRERDGASLPTPDHRAARDVHPSDVGSAHRWCALLPATARVRDRPASARRRRRGQRVRVSGARDRRGAVRTDRVVQPSRNPRSPYPTDDDSEWAAFRAEYDRVHRPLWSEFDEWVRSCGAPGLADLEFVHESGVANLYVYPEAADYVGRRPLATTWHRLESSVRGTERGFDPAPELADLLDRPGGALVYLSLGSLGSADVELMERLVETLSGTAHRYIVSKGPLADSYDLADNMWGDSQVPQTQVLPLVNLVITHGGNNTTTESFHFGKPMVVLPLFWDQHDNAQRVHEMGFGRRLPTYDHLGSELVAAVDTLVADRALRNRMSALGAEIREGRGTERAATLIEKAAEPGHGRAG